MIFLGGAMVFAASRKQKCVTKLPTESKLVTLIDHISFAEALVDVSGFIASEETKAIIIIMFVCYISH